MGKRSGREKSGLYLLEGVRLLEEALAAQVPMRQVVYGKKLLENSRGQACLGALSAAGIPIRLLDDALLAEVSDTETSQGILAMAHIPDSGADRNFWQATFFLVLDGVQDPGNLGTILRTSEAFGVERVVCLKGTVDPYNQKVIRSAMGALFRIPLLHSQSHDLVFAELKRSEVVVLVGDPEAATLYNQVRFPDRVALVVGNEGAGVSQFWSDRAQLSVRIPTAPNTESLNVAVATGVLLSRIAENRQ